MKNFVLSALLKEDDFNGCTIHHDMRIISAKSLDEAFGKYTIKTLEKYPKSNLMAKPLCIELDN